ncbi:MAG TPA: hypothetical protein DDZ51_24345 [Planctomycetaceae bacterium]|nr:hypothetical protein [Planctomycetaceae bacterium]
MSTFDIPASISAAQEPIEPQQNSVTAMSIRSETKAVFGTAGRCNVHLSRDDASLMAGLQT